jgi:hypothetical protein
MIFEIPSNLMLAKNGFGKTLLRIMLLWATCSVLLAIMTSPGFYYFARFLLGAAEAGLAPALLFAIVVFFFLKDTPASAPWLSLREGNLIEADLEADRTRSGGGHHSFMDALRSPSLYLLVGMGVALLASASSISFWLPTIIFNALASRAPGPLA